ncbi:MAG: rod shape-determining protein RodA [Clostridia bacterium]|nr:rod shape-determining protein RodA [Clostridia bacterium]
MEFNKNKLLQQFRNIDFITLGLAIALSVYGLILVFSATNSYETYKYLLVQGAGCCLGLMCVAVICFFGYDTLSKISPFLYAFGVLFLLSVFIFGKEVDGNKNWLRFFGIGIQPSEIVKIIFIISFATHINIVKEHLNNIKSLASLLLHFGIFAVIIAIQGDFGTVFVYCAIVIGMLFCAGLRLRIFGIGILGAAGALVFLWNFVFKNYQKQRVLLTFNPELDPQGFGYQAIQSKIAVGAGGVSGKGYLQGLQNQFSILPAKQTDFIFSVCGEEFGFLGCVLLIGLFVCLFLRILYISSLARDHVGSYICVGVFSMLFFQMVENIGMCIGILPVIGITLPFLSYGGSSIVSVWMAVGLIMSVYSQRDMSIFRSRM